MKNDDLVIPIRTRGPIQRSEPVPIRTRGAIRRPAASPQLADLVTNLREQLNYLPLTAFIHGWGSPSRTTSSAAEPAKVFVEKLLPFLREEDALWLIPGYDYQLLPPEQDLEGVLLDFSSDTDRRTYDNMMCDIAFFPALETSETEQIAQLERRARAIIVDGRGVISDAVLRAGRMAGLTMWRWSGEMIVDPYVRP
jgi:hypothetical protein